MKKIITLLLLISTFIYGSTLNLNLSDGFTQGQSWDIDMADSTTNYLMLPIEVEYSDLQSTLNNDETLRIYGWYQRSDMFNADLGVNFLVLIRVRKDSIVYFLQDVDGTWKNWDNFSGLESYLSTNIAPLIVDTNKRSVFVNSYVPSLNKINKNRIYLVKASGTDYKFSVDLDIDGSSSTGDTGTTPDPSALEPPPSPTTTDSAIELPPQIPTLN